MAAIGAFEARESRGKITAAEEGYDGGSGCGVERAEILAVFAFVVGEEFVPAVVNELPEW